ncbi:M14 family zinc carboxypeptidase [Streptomyces lonegramiae]|uniref:M14 family zinc carboxypeptidase n=1 Tax=Streptomyces lonegramiae TaxID=3075524 RepID=A0ABU2XTG3_9ACTN|nr:M14 family zinc carboxypeptidase [Streptomyces sp. DSM 41529]MDT0549215.1 M14 family zinc carboxypeptidase [Streptomyces sp. DSM 41529]
MNTGEYLSRVPGSTAFPSVDAMHAELDALAATHPDLVRLRRIGTSRLGEPLRALTVGDGPADAVVIGGPHPNEPVGGLTVRALIKLLCEDPELRAKLGHRWHFVPCADPDGARLNEAWYSRPGDRRGYVRHFFRPDLSEQVEWTFPLAEGDYRFDRTLPETAALMRLMDEVRPSLVYSLHNGEYHGAFFYLNRDDPALAERLAGLPGEEGLPPHHGEPELPGAKPIAPAVYLTPAGAHVGAAFGAGGSSADYAARFGALHLVAEVPYWADDRVSDRSATDRPYGEVVAEAAVARRELIETLKAAMRAVSGDLTVPSPFRRSTESTLETFRRMAELEESRPGPGPGLGRPATVAEEFSSRQTTHLLRLRLLGVFLRMLDAELAAGNLTPAIREQHRALTERFDQWYGQAEADSPGLPVELRKLVAVQLGAALIAASHAAEGAAPS